MSRFLSFIVCFAVLECFAGSTHTGTPVSLKALRDAPQSIRVDGVVVHLKADVWRDFMPGLLSDTDTQSEDSAVSGKPMTAALRVIVRNGLRMPQGMRVDVAWVILRDRIWQSQPSEEQPRDPAAHEVAVTIRNGPKWPPQAIVDIVVRIVDGNGATYLLASRGQKIRAAM
jgi:hypothetical protein